MTFKRKMQEIKRDLIIEEATNLFIRDGYENMKIVDLAKNAGVSIGAIYSMFGSKEALYNQYIMGQIEFYIEMMEQELENHTDPIEMLRVVTRIKFEAIMKNKNGIKEHLMSDPTFYLHASFDDNNPLMHMYMYISEKIMEPLAKSLGNTVQPMELFFIYDGLTFGMAKYWILTGGDLMRRINQSIEMFLTILKKD
ncbi:TetR/AcrR family transcriptional regulator [Sulfuricurvum sp.]|uniref:TetR/AcrR family transcriptional regulator n=1 Tax=Sulfuricurvum sp. TaxID=2025608 RepID=UPI003BB1104A